MPSISVLQADKKDSNDDSFAVLEESVREPGDQEQQELKQTQQLGIKTTGRFLPTATVTC